MSIPVLYVRDQSTGEWTPIRHFRGAPGVRGSRWYAGTAITGTSTAPTAYATGITDAIDGDMYINTATSYVYKCTQGGDESTALWVYSHSQKGLDGGGAGDMTKAVYDADNDGIVDNAAKLGGLPPEDYAKKSDIPSAINTHDGDSGAHSTQFNAKEKLLKNLSEKSSIADNDSFAMVDSAASDVSKRTLWSTIKSALKTYFDTLYNKYTHPTFTAKSSGLWKITVNSEGHVIDASAVQKSDIVNLGIPGQDTIYVHPTGDGNLHVPATSTNNNGKVLKAGATAGSIAWGTLTAADVGAATSTDITNAISSHNSNGSAHSTQFNAKLDTSGGTMTGMLTLQDDPSQPMHAATKQYVDSKTSVFNVTLNTSWSGSAAPYSKSVTVTGILATDTPIIDVVMSGTYATDKARQEAWAYIYRAVTANNSITFYANEKPTVELPVQIKVVR